MPQRICQAQEFLRQTSLGTPACPLFGAVFDSKNQNVQAPSLGEGHENTLASLALVFAGCASTGLVSTGPDTYMWPKPAARPVVWCRSNRTALPRSKCVLCRSKQAPSNSQCRCPGLKAFCEACEFKLKFRWDGRPSASAGTSPAPGRAAARRARRPHQTGKNRRSAPGSRAKRRLNPRHPPRGRDRAAHRR